MLSFLSTVDAEQSTLQLVMDQLEELIVSIIEEIRERPGVAAAILAAIAGVIVGSMLASAVRPRRRLPARGLRTPKPVRRAGDVAELAGLGLRLLENPIVRAALIAQLKRRLTRG